MDRHLMSQEVQGESINTLGAIIIILHRQIKLMIKAMITRVSLHSKLLKRSALKLFILLPHRVN